VEVLVDGEVAGLGQGRKKADAERAAAEEALEGLGRPPSAA
jgi:dsRNA-specific ribonuclease